MQLALSPLFMLLASTKVLRWLTAALAAIWLAFMLLTQSPHPDQCHPDKQGQTQRGFSMTQTLSPTTVNPFNQCPGGPRFSIGDFKFR